MKRSILLILLSTVCASTVAQWQEAFQKLNTQMDAIPAELETLREELSNIIEEYRSSPSTELKSKFNQTKEAMLKKVDDINKEFRQFATSFPDVGFSAKETLFADLRKDIETMTLE